MAQLEQRQRQHKAFVDRHRKGMEKALTIGKPVLVFQTRLGAMPGKLRFQWTSPFWIIDEFNDTFQLGTLAGDIVKSWVNGFRLRPYQGNTPANPFTESHGTDQLPDDTMKEATCTEPRSSSFIALSRSRLIVLPHSSNQKTLDYTMPLAASQETHSWLQE